MLELIASGKSCGIVGTQTLNVCKGQRVCIGDFVRIAKNQAWAETDALIITVDGEANAMGLVGYNVRYLNITSIIKSHKELKDGDTIIDVDTFTVKEID